MKQNAIKQKQLIPRRLAAELLGYDSVRSLRRMELSGKLTPIALNKRRTLYSLAQVQSFLGGGQ